MSISMNETSEDKKFPWKRRDWHVTRPTSPTISNQIYLSHKVEAVVGRSKMAHNDKMGFGQPKPSALPRNTGGSYIAEETTRATPNEPQGQDAEARHKAYIAKAEQEIP